MIDIEWTVKRVKLIDKAIKELEEERERLIKNSLEEVAERLFTEELKRKYDILKDICK